jgi:exosortase
MLSKPTIKAIILAGTHNFGQCAVAAHLPAALWPVAGKPVLERLLTSLAEQGIKQVTICAGDDNTLSLQSIHIDNRLEVKFLDEPLPVGTAGCIRDATRDETDVVFIVFPAAIISPPKIDVLLEAHRKGNCDLTIMLNPADGNSGLSEQTSGIYVCNATILQHIPKDGYFDIKEGLIPEMLRRGKSVNAAVLPHHVGNFRGWREYMDAISNYLENTPNLDVGLNHSKRPDQQGIWTSDSSKIDKNARIYGPTVIMDGAIVSSGAAIIGPTIIGNNVTIGENNIIVNSVVWDGAKVGPNCEIQKCLIDYDAVVRGGSIVHEKVIPFKPVGLAENLTRSEATVTKVYAGKIRHILQPHFDKINKSLPDWAVSNKKNILAIIAAGFVLIAFLWSYWPDITDLWRTWQRSDEYSSGLLVPFLTVYILWSRRHDLAKCPIRPCIWGVLAFLGAQAIRLFGLFFLYGSAERLSIALTIASLVLLLLGWQFLRKVSTVLLFLCLMLPWPNRVQAAVALPLQRWATSSAVFCLETMGYEVMREGNIIHIGQSSVAVAEACNGLRMVTAFFVISGLVVLLVRRPLWEKLVILASSLPIALLCNTIRLTVTALAFTVISGEQWEKIFHDFGGYAMMPLALAAVVGELWIMTKLTIAPTKQESIIVTRQKAD